MGSGTRKGGKNAFKESITESNYQGTELFSFNVIGINWMRAGLFIFSKPEKKTSGMPGKKGICKVVYKIRSVYFYDFE